MDFKSDFPETTCICPKCVEMCHRVPCWPTPDEAEKIIKAGFGDRLKTIENSGYSRNPVTLQSPAISGEEGRLTSSRMGRCTFLKDGRCELHALGLKPLEGRVANHTTSESSDPVRQYILSLWAEKVKQDPPWEPYYLWKPSIS